MQKTWFQWIGLWTLLIIFPLLNRTLLPIDETRYVTVAWEMWLQNSWFVPTLNGEFYHHKPPLLFWLIQMGWGMFGVNEWWVRLIPGIFALGNLYLVTHIARQLWSKQIQIAQWTPLILLSCLLWSVFASAVMFDMVLSFFVLLGIIAIIQAWQTQAIKAWGLLGLAIGLGILTKGPVILLHLLPVALLAPWWQKKCTFPWRFWYLGLLSSLILGIVMALMWAIPAGIIAGEEFQRAIFWGQTANRIINSFAHKHSFGWYLFLLPAILFPWLLWLPTWRSLSKINRHLHNEGVRFCIVWFLFTLIAFSFISGKQAHYLLPVLPAFALLIAYLLFFVEKQYSSWDNVFVIISLFIIGILLITAPYLQLQISVLPDWVKQTPISSGIILLLLAGLLFIKTKQRILQLSLIAVLFNLIVPLTIIRSSGSAYDLSEMSYRIHTMQQQGQSIAHLGEYYGQYQFLGRLQKPLVIVEEYDICAWLNQYPDSQIIVYFPSKYQGLSQYADYIQIYRSKQVGIIQAKFLYSICYYRI